MLNIEKPARFEPRLQPLASMIRQALSQCAPKSLAALTLLAGLSAGPASAATITVNAGCTLIDAITAANSDLATGGCPAGSGADTIVLPAKSVQTLTTVNNFYFEGTGLPLITSAITIVGNGSTIRRDPAAPQFRILKVASNGNLTLNSTTVSGGSVPRFGGGIYNKGVLSLNNSTVSGNSASGYNSHGGGILNQNFATLTLNNSTVSGNAANASGGNGGGIANENFATLTLNNSSVSGNAANASGGKGGGIYNEFYASAILNNSTVSGNVARYGGGINNFDSSTLVVTNSTLTQNTADKGGAIDSRSTSSLRLSRSLISGNTAESRSAEIYSWSTAVSADNHNLFGHDSASGVYGFTPGATDIVPSQPVSAILGALAANGGPTQTHLLVAGSPAIDASPHDAACKKVDQRGIGRPQGAACDIGAVEVTSCDTATPTTGCTVNGVANQRCEGTDSADTIIGTGGKDIIRGLGGNDILKGYGGNDKLCGGAGNDRLYGVGGNDQLFGGFGRDFLRGGDGTDSLFGEQDNDNLDGGLGADQLNGGPGLKDTCASDADDTSKIGCEL